jgi:hypothetical protein
MLNVPVVLLVAAAAVLVGVIYVATGRGGELAFFHPDYAPLKMDQVTSTDVALFRPPSALWGYSMQATDEALSRIANAITERDIEISALQQQVADLEAAAGRRRGHTGPEPPGGRVEPPGGCVEPPGGRVEPPGGRVEPQARRRILAARPPEPDVIGSAPEDQDIPLPDRAVRQDEPRPAEQDAPPPGDRPEQAGSDGKDIWRPVTSAGRAVPATQPGHRPGQEQGQKPAESAAPPTVPWIRRAGSGGLSPAQWAGLPKRADPPSAPDGPAADVEEDGG